MTLRAYYKTIETKREAVANARSHRRQDKLIKGSYGSHSENPALDFRGGSVGCTYAPFAEHWKPNAHNPAEDVQDLHKLSEKVHGIPEWLTLVRDHIFETLPDDQIENWHVDFTSAPRTGAYLNEIFEPFSNWLQKKYGTDDYNLRFFVDNKIEFDDVLRTSGASPPASAKKLLALMRGCRHELSPSI